MKKIKLTDLAKATGYHIRTLRNIVSGETSIFHLGKGKGYNDRRDAYIKNAKVGLFVESISTGALYRYYGKDLIKDSGKVKAKDELKRLALVGEKFGCFIQDEVIEKFVK